MQARGVVLPNLFLIKNFQPMGTNSTKHPLPQLTPTPVSEISVILLSQDPGRYIGHVLIITLLCNWELDVVFMNRVSFTN